MEAAKYDWLCQSVKLLLKDGADMEVKDHVRHDQNVIIIQRSDYTVHYYSAEERLYSSPFPRGILMSCQFCYQLVPIQI